MLNNCDCPPHKGVGHKERTKPKPWTLAKPRKDLWDAGQTSLWSPGKALGRVMLSAALLPSPMADGVRLTTLLPVQS